MEVSRPRPSLLFWVGSVLVIVGGLGVIAGVLVEIAFRLNPFAIVGAVLLLPFAVLLVILQYVGTFQRRGSFALVAGVILYVVAGLCLFALVVSAGEAVVEETSIGLMMPFLGALLALTVGFVVMGRLNWLWGVKLRAAEVRAGAEAAGVRVSFKEVFVGLGVVVVLGGMLWKVGDYGLPPVAENVKASKAPIDLPEGAREVSYYDGGGALMVCEFTAEEARFREWVEGGIGSIEARSAGVELVEIDSPVSVPRYCKYLPEGEGQSVMMIEEGLSYSWRKEDRGVHAAYDRRSGRGFVYMHFR